MEQIHATQYNLLRQQVEHEDNLMTQRLSWLVAAQSFMFTAYAIVLNAPEHAATLMHARQQGYLIAVIPSVAIATNALIFMSVVAGGMAMRALRTQWASVSEAGEMPAIQGSALTRGMGLAPPILLPLVFLGVWIFLIWQG